MSTGAILAIPTDPDDDTSLFRGRYLNWDGYPEHVVRTLLEFIKRDGVDTVISTLITGDNTEWSSIHVAPSLYTHTDVDVQGYGVRYVDQHNEWLTDHSVPSAAWAYVIDSKAITVMQRRDSNEWYITERVMHLDVPDDDDDVVQVQRIELLNKPRVCPGLEGSVIIATWNLPDDPKQHPAFVALVHCASQHVDAQHAWSTHVVYCSNNNYVWHATAGHYDLTLSEAQADFIERSNKS